MQLDKYSDDFALADFSNSDSHFEQQVNEVTRWCKDNYLDLNVEKTREMVIDFKRNGCVGEHVIEGVIVEKVNEYKYLGTVLDNKLTFESNTSCIVKKCNWRMFCMFRLRSFGVSRKTLQMFYRSFIESVLTSYFVCWFGTVSVKNRGRLNSIVNRGSKVVGVRQTGLSELYKKRTMRKGLQIMSDVCHILSQYYDTLPSSRRLRAFIAKKAKTLNSFVPMPTKIINKS